VIAPTLPDNPTVWCNHDGSALEIAEDLSLRQMKKEIVRLSMNWQKTRVRAVIRTLSTQEQFHVHWTSMSRTVVLLPVLWKSVSPATGPFGSAWPMLNSSYESFYAWDMDCSKLITNAFT